MSTPELRWATAADTPGLLALFQRAFGHAMTAAEWHWKYAPPGGRSLVAVRGAQVVGHYGGQSRRLLGLGEPLRAVQAGDSMVAASERGALGRNGLFAQLARTFAADVSAPADGHAFVFGFPSPRATRLGETLRIYHPVDRLEQVIWPAQDDAVRGPVAACSLAALMALGERLWAQQARALGARHLLGVRDGPWIGQRYLTRPGEPYGALLYRARWRRRLGALVYRTHPDVLEAVDLLGAPQTYPLLVQALRARARAQGLQGVVAWLTPAAQTGLPAPARCESALRVNMAGPRAAAAAARYHGRCWMMGGDTDYR